MKKNILLFLALAALLVSSCGKSYKDMRVTGFQIVSVTPEGSTGGTALVKIGLDNPVTSFELTDASGTLRVGGTQSVTISADQLMVAGKCEKEYFVPVQMKIAEDANLFDLLNLLKAAEVPDLSMDVSARVALRGGMGVRINKNIPLGDKMHLGGFVSNMAGKSLMNFTVTSLEVCSIETEGTDKCRILVRMGLQNPYLPFELSNIAGTLKLDGVSGISFNDKDLTVVSRGDNEYYLSFDANFEESFNPCTILGLLAETCNSTVTADFSMRIAARGGIGKTFSWTDIPIGTVKQN